MQHRKYVEPKRKKNKKKNDGYDIKIFIVVNAHKKQAYDFYQ
jgi:hypothetical protein